MIQLVNYRLRNGNFCTVTTQPPTMTYMKEVNNLFKVNHEVANKYYRITTNYLLGKGVLVRPPYVTIPRQIEFIEDKNYMSGFNLF